MNDEQYTSDENLLDWKKKEIDEDVAGTAKEIELLKRRQNDLETRKKKMEEISVKQSEYENKKREAILLLSKSIILLEKEEVRMAKLVELLADTREQFKGVLEDIKSINEDNWNDADFEEQLNDAIVVVDNALLLYKKNISKIDVLTEKKIAKNLYDSDSSENLKNNECHSFGYWLKAGIAFSLPMIAVIIILFVVYLFLNGVI